MGRLLAIGDIHGYLQPLELLIHRLAPTTTDTVVVLGDVVDRGPDSRACIELLIALEEGTNLVVLMGNHEELMLHGRRSLGDLGTWTAFGGHATLESYDLEGSGPRLEHIPGDHWSFVERFRDYYETESEIFVHGMIRHDVPMEEQEARDLRWRKFWAPQAHMSGKTVICGHTAQQSGLPLKTTGAVCIDTHIYGGGWLTCYDVAGRMAYQTNAAGDERTVEFDEFAVLSD